MTKDEGPKAPAGTRAGGLRLWRSVVADFDLDEHELALLREAARCVDTLDELDARVKVDGAVISSPQGLKAHPAAVEARQQRITLARLLAALRVPLGDEQDQAGNARPQKRAGVRGVYGIRGSVS
jgi:hypothetical protein